MMQLGIMFAFWYARITNLQAQHKAIENGTISQISSEHSLLHSRKNFSSTFGSLNNQVFE